MANPKDRLHGTLDILVLKTLSWGARHGYAVARWIEESSLSIRSCDTGRLRQAIATERSSLSRSNGSRRFSDLTTVSSRNCTRSKVVKRAPQSSHWRRRRIAEPSSVGRLSFTWLFSWAQKGQRKVRPCPEPASPDRIDFNPECDSLPAVPQ